MVKVNVQLTFLDWREAGIRLMGTEQNIDLSSGVFHGGSTFDGLIELENEDAAELRAAVAQGYQPCWIMYFPKNDAK